ncbi:ArnT family glycosyltransferase [Haloglomus litoreum]|uniref:ArnT family glycosyltransferase n=1 Tax=Haloglomus litoreum TaxID=3034026 RepID=UPI0023E85BED|nr:glycosyltransferase family 39 protein [Haloglomus sp. DT116]
MRRPPPPLAGLVPDDSRARYRLAAAALAVLAGVGVLLLSHRVFPHLSTNHDEGVYLQQAAMLLDGQLVLRPPVDLTFRPWFFVKAGPELYPKYTPVTAAVFAVGMALGDPRLSLAAVAAALVALTYAVGAEAFDRRTAVLGAALVAASPFYLVQTAVFLPYAPTLAVELLFAWAYLRAVRTGSRPFAALAGLAIGVAFFARPYTAVLFAAPFVAHALWTLARARAAPEPSLVAVTTRQGVVAACGLLGVIATLGYNAVVTGDPFTFPYQVFAPRDGLGFGTRRILGYERDYTPALALEANARVVRAFLTRWVVAGPLGTALAVVGLGATAARARRALARRERGLVGAVVRPDGGSGDTSERGSLAPRLLLAGLFGSIVAGNVYFWGNLNVLGDVDVPGDGLVSLYGPYYHFDLVVPVALFAAFGLRLLAGRWRTAVDRRFDGATASRLVVAGLLVGGLVLGGTTVAMAADPVADNEDASEQLAAAYEPFEPRPPAGVVFLPTPYGDWLNHPFQALRNEPGFDGRTVYAMRERQFAVVDAYPDRQLYRYGFRGDWAPFLGTPVEPRLYPIEHVRGERVTVHTSLGVPAGVDTMTARLAGGGESTYYTVRGPPETVDARIVVANGTARLLGDDVAPVNANDTSVPVHARDEVLLEVNAEYAPGNAFTYRLETPVALDEGEWRILTPHPEVCRGANLCDGEAAWIPGTARPGVTVETRVTAGTANRTELEGQRP